MQVGKSVLTEAVLDHSAKQLVNNTCSHMQTDTFLAQRTTCNDTNNLIWEGKKEIIFYGPSVLKTDRHV